MLLQWERADIPGVIDRANRVVLNALGVRKLTSSDCALANTGAAKSIIKERARTENAKRGDFVRDMALLWNKD